MAEECGRCKFWKHARTEYGNCRRFPPVLDTLQVAYADENGAHPDSFANDSIAWWSHPMTCQDDWCGEFQDKQQ